MISNEPVAASAAIQGLIAAVIAALVAFNVWNPTPDQTGAVFGLWVALVAVSAVLVRNRVTPAP